MSINEIKSQIKASMDVKMLFLQNELLLQKVFDLASHCTQCLSRGGKIIFCGNGGSFADAQHLSAEFTSKFMLNRSGLASITLGTNSSALTAIGNDYGYDQVFAREIEAIGTHADILIAITTSGNSTNIITAIEAAKSKNIPVVVFAGQSNGKVIDTLDVINVPSSNTARIQECHILIGHIVCGIVEQNMFGNSR